MYTFEIIFLGNPRMFLEVLHFVDRASCNDSW